MTLVMLIATLFGCNSAEFNKKKSIKAVEVFSCDVEVNSTFSFEHGKFSYLEYQNASAFDIEFHEFIASSPDSIREVKNQIYSSSELKKLIIRLSKSPLYIASVKDFSFEYDEQPKELRIPIDTSKVVEHFRIFQSFKFSILKNRTSADCQLLIYDQADGSFGFTNLPNYAPYWADFLLFDLFGDGLPEIITITPNYIGGRDIYSIDIFRIDKYISTKKPF